MKHTPKADSAFVKGAFRDTVQYFVHPVMKKKNHLWYYTFPSIDNKIIGKIIVLIFYCPSEIKYTNSAT